MLKIIPLGGLGEIGLNMMVVEYEQYLLIVDAGLMFPDDYMPGVDLVIPDFKYLKENRKKVKAVILTHGHEDHIGAMPFLLREFPVPVFGTGFTLALLKEKLKDYYLPFQVDLNKIKSGDINEFGPFQVEYISVNHSIVDGVGLAIKTPEGMIVHSGDFRIDPTPVDNQFTDLIRFAHFGQEGVLALFSDSTNVEKEGFTMSEQEVRKTLADLFQVSRGRIIIASFASNISRVQQVISLAMEFDRKVVFNGKSMVTNVGIARELGFIDMPDDLEISERQISQFSDKNIAVIITGSQGEPMSALTRMSQGRHKGIKIKKGDTIILSSRFIPGNEKAITAVINRLFHMGADVIYEKISDIHTSGHAKREELKLLMNIVKPRYFVPVHGEFRHLVRHARLALDMGIPEDHVLLAEDGSVICFEEQEARLNGTVYTGRIFVDGKWANNVGEMVLKDRIKLGEHGMVLVSMAVDENTGDIIYGPDITSKGFIFEDYGGYILEDGKCIVLEVIDEIEKTLIIDWTKVQADIKKRLKNFFYNAIERRPLIMVSILPV